MALIDLHRPQRNFLALNFDQKLERLCNLWEIAPVGYWEYPEGRVYIAEGWKAKLPELNSSGWTIVWAVRRQGLCVAQALYVATASTKESRRRAAFENALLFLKDADGQAQRRTN